MKSPDFKSMDRAAYDEYVACLACYGIQIVSIPEHLLESVLESPPEGSMVRIKVVGGDEDEPDVDEPEPFEWHGSPIQFLAYIIGRNAVSPWERTGWSINPYADHVADVQYRLDISAGHVFSMGEGVYEAETVEKMEDDTKAHKYRNGGVEVTLLFDSKNRDPVRYCVHKEYSPPCRGWSKSSEGVITSLGDIVVLKEALARGHLIHVERPRV